MNPIENKLMTVFDLDKNQPIAFLPMAGGPDVIKFDSGLKRIYVACSSGAISVFKMDDPDHTVWQWALRLTVSTRRSRRQTVKPLRA